MFDPYHKWLGISRKDQPPNHYRLLGIELFESDLDVIDAAANKQMAYVQGCATGPHTAASQKILNEIAAARLCLLNPAKKADYDAKLKARVAQPSASNPQPAAAGSSEALTATPTRRLHRALTRQIASPQAFDFSTQTAPSARSIRNRSRRPSKRSLVLTGSLVLGAACLVLLTLLLLHLLRPSKGERQLAGLPPKASRWAHLDLSAAIAADEFVRLSPGSAIHTKEAHAGPIEVVVVARTQRNNIRLCAFKGACVIFNWEVRRDELRVHRPDGNDSHRESGSIATARIEPLAANTWYTLRWRITEQGMEIAVNGKIVFSETRAYNLSAKRPVTVKAIDSVVDVRSFDVKPYAAKKERRKAVTWQNYTPLPIDDTATIDSGTCYRNKDGAIIWGDRVFFDVPFRLVDPEGGKRKNVIALYGKAGWELEMPRVVKVRCNSTARTIHLLGGVATRALPWHQQQTTTMVVRLHYEDGESEDHALVNGVHITDWDIGPDVPDSKRIPIEGNAHIRYLTVVPKSRDRKITTIEFRKGDDNCGPWVMAVTIEK